MSILDKDDIEIVKGLFRNGWSVWDIAARMGVPSREIELITKEIDREQMRRDAGLKK